MMLNLTFLSAKFNPDKEFIEKDYLSEENAMKREGLEKAYSQERRVLLEKCHYTFTIEKKLYKIVSLVYCVLKGTDFLNTLNV